MWLALAHIVLGSLNLLIQLADEDVNGIAQLDKTLVTHQIITKA